MGWIALFLALAAAVAATVVPSPGMFLGMGLAIFAGACGWVAFRRRAAPAAARLAGAGAVGVGGLALVVSLVKYGLTLGALHHLERIFS